MDTNSHMFKETHGIVRGHRREGLGKRFIKCIDRTRSRFSQVMFNFGPRSFTRIEVRGIGRSIEQTSAFTFDQFTHVFHTLRFSMIQNNYPGPEYRTMFEKEIPVPSWSLPITGRSASHGPSRRPSYSGVSPAR
jgi:hypothetical protein